MGVVLQTDAAVTLVQYNLKFPLKRQSRRGDFRRDGEHIRRRGVGGNRDARETAET